MQLIDILLILGLYLNLFYPDYEQFGGLAFLLAV